MKSKKINPVILVIAAFVIFLNIIKCDDTSDDIQPSITDSEIVTGDITLWPPKLGEIPVELEQNPLKKNYYLIFDGSGSMQGEKLRTAKKALLEFIKIIPDEANIGLLVFDDNGISERVNLGRDRTKLEEEINSVVADRGTPLKSAISMAYQSLEMQGHRQQGYGEYHMVIVTDGEASTGEDPRGSVDAIIGYSPIVIHTLGFQIGQNHSLNQPGKTLYKSATNLDELSRGLENVLAESESFSVTNF